MLAVLSQIIQSRDKRLWMCTGVVLCCRMCQRMAYICHHDSSISFSYQVNSNRTVTIPLYPWLVMCLTNFLHNTGCLVLEYYFVRKIYSTTMNASSKCVDHPCHWNWANSVSPEYLVNVSSKNFNSSIEVKVHHTTKGLHRLDYQIFFGLKHQLM